jgi:hypothetical protein
MRGAYQVLTDCPHCRVEGALLELMDPSERIGVPLESRCRLCGFATELGDTTALPTPLLDEEDVVHALARWAEGDGEADVHVFAAANFGGLTPRSVAQRVLNGQRVETTFDVVAFLFPAMSGGASTGGAAERVELRPRPRELVREAPPPGPPPVEPLAAARALVSVMVADGHLRPAERVFVARTLERLGAPDMPESEWRVWRPHEVGRPADPAAFIQAMRALALCDKEPDGSEARVILEYARAWGVTVPEEVLPRHGAMAQLGRFLGRLIGG